MRYDNLIYFVSVAQGAYDPDTGDYADGTETETPVYASVMDTQADTLRLVYGGLVEGSYTLHIQNHYTDSFDFIRIDGKDYDVDFRRKLRTKEAFIVHEKQKGVTPVTSA